jgi:hypothetical protein
MTDCNSRDVPHLGTLPRPGLFARVRFFASRHPVAVAVPLALIIAFGAATLAAFALEFSPERRGVFIPGVVAISLTAVGMVILPAIARMHSIASSRDIAAAMVAATERERPHLLAEIEGRLSNPYWPAPMTVLQLVMMFREVRQAHGDRAYRRQRREREARTEQERSIAQLSMRQ